MKKLILNILLFFLALTPLMANPSPEAYFCTKKGTTLGYGLVRHDTFFPNGQLESSEQLVSVSV